VRKSDNWYDAIALGRCPLMPVVYMSLPPLSSVGSTKTIGIFRSFCRVESAVPISNAHKKFKNAFRRDLLSKFVFSATKPSPFVSFLCLS